MIHEYVPHSEVSKCFRQKPPQLASKDNRRCNMYAIIATGGKQYRVAEGDSIKIEKIEAEVGSVVTFDQVLCVNNGELTIGCPTVAGATVSATVEKVGKGKKVF